MAYTTPTTRTTGDLIDAEIWNDDVVENIKALKTLVDTVIPSGLIAPYAGSLIPSGWLLCSGQAVSRSTYATLFGVIGTTYGSGNGTTTFNVPDLRGRFPLPTDNMGGSSANRVTAAAADTIGGTGGAETHTLTTTEMPSHTHSVSAPNNSTPGPGPDWYAGNNSGTGARTSGSAGSDGAHNNMPPYMAMQFLIKT